MQRFVLSQLLNAARDKQRETKRPQTFEQTGKQVTIQGKTVFSQMIRDVTYEAADSSSELVTAGPQSSVESDRADILQQIRINEQMCVDQFISLC